MQYKIGLWKIIANNPNRRRPIPQIKRAKPHTVKSVFVVQAYIVRPEVSTAVIVKAIKTSCT